MIIKVPCHSNDGGQFHYVLKDLGDAYLVDGGHTTAERALWEYKWKLEHGIKMCKFIISKKDVIYDLKT